MQTLANNHKQIYPASKWLRIAHKSKPPIKLYYTLPLWTADWLLEAGQLHRLCTISRSSSYTVVSNSLGVLELFLSA